MPVKSTRRTPATKRKKSGDKKPIPATALLTAGMLAPDFNLPNQDGQMVCLSDLRGKAVVVYFYPRAMTPGCTVQACGIRDHFASFRKAKAVVLGISSDKPAALLKFRERDKLPFDLLSDADNEVAKAYGVWGLKKFMGREFMGVRRWTFIINPDGVISHLLDKVNTQTHHDDVLTLLNN